MADIDDEIRSKTEAFAADIAVLVRQLALQTVQTALGSGVAATKLALPFKAAPAPAKAVAAATTKARPPAGKAAAPAKAPARQVTRKVAAPPRAPGEKRPPAELAKLVEKLGEYIKAHPGLRMEAIGKGLGLPTRELNLPVKKLLASKRVRVEGHKRATEYYPA
jgi:hypothetical protein